MASRIIYIICICKFILTNNRNKVNIFWRWIQYFIVQCIVRELSCGLPLKQQDIRIMKIKANKNYFSPDTKISLGTSDFSLIFHWKQIFFLPPPHSIAHIMEKSCKIICLWEILQLVMKSLDWYWFNNLQYVVQNQII